MMRRGTLISLLFLVALLAGGSYALWSWLDRPIERVSIRGGDMRHVGADYLRNQLSPLVSDRRWLSVDLDELREQALEIGWLKEVHIRREWPDGLTFELLEQSPVARWNDDQLLNGDGEPFDFAPAEVPDGLIFLSGPNDSGPEVLAFHGELEKRLKQHGMEVAQLRLEDRGAWRFQLEDGLWIMLGRANQEARLERFEAVWQRRLAELAAHLRYIDLRYPNGVAVAWHGETEPIESAD
ncbi:MAG: cell division protein FtsQ/DivIB [Halomonas sp.]|uniref:cell division protein FtsQ/DivIB n=1 Tax=Halomonas sp. TaxID=1486246 RepID=UPI003F911D17